MARYTSDTTVNIPANATNITLFVAAGSGGRGGDDGNPGGSGGGGRWGTFILPSFTPRTLTLRIGKKGGDGFGCVSNSGAGSGGSSSVASGGGGGRTGPQGCSGGGAGGGGASAIYDSLKNGYIIIAAGGGGGGGASYPDSYLRGGTGGFGLGFETGNLSSISGGGTGASQGFDGGGGGGGGGGCPGGGGGREGADDRAGRYASGGGAGGASSYDSGYVIFTGSGTNQFGDGYIDVDYTLVSASINSFTANPTAIIRGQSSTLSWSTTNATSASINQGVGSVPVNGQRVVTPDETTTYTLSIVGLGNTSDVKTATITVYIPPEVVLSASKNPLIAGECATLNWYTTGDADTITFSPDINNRNLTSSATVCPTQSTTYTATVSGLGGTDSDSLLIRVYQIPTLTISGSDSLLYGAQGSISYTTSYSDISLTITPIYTYEVDQLVTGDTVQLNHPNSAESGVGITSVSGIYDTEIPYNNRGPISVQYVVVATGSGGIITKVLTIPIIIDRTPDNILVEETDEKFKSEDPVFTPETEILTEKMLVDGIDIDVEIKASHPIQVDVNGENDWKNLREL
jgi:hypothetical protein